MPIKSKKSESCFPGLVSCNNPTSYHKHGAGIVSGVAVLRVLDALLPVVHDQLDPEPEREGVAEKDEEPEQSHADAREQAPEDLRPAGEYQQALVARNLLVLALKCDHSPDEKKKEKYTAA